MKISIIGVGRLGGALALALSKSGYTLENLISRRLADAQKIAELIEPRPQFFSSDNFSNLASEIIFIAVQDSQIEDAAKNLVGKTIGKPYIFHLSGALSSDVLQPLKEIGCKIGSIHPLVAISDSMLGAKRFENGYFCVEGNAESLEIAEKVVTDLKGKYFRVATAYKTLYHASAVTVSGHFVALFDVAIEMLNKCGLEKASAQEIFLPLIKSTIENLQTQMPAAALTGTFARADVQTFDRHLEILRENVSNEAVEIYLQLGERSVRLAEQQGANQEKLAEILEKIRLAKKNFKC